MIQQDESLVKVIFIDDLAIIIIIGVSDNSIVCHHYLVHAVPVVRHSIRPALVMADCVDLN